MTQKNPLLIYCAFLVWALVVAGFPLYGEQQADCAVLKSVRSWIGKDRIRFVFDFEGRPSPWGRLSVIHDTPRLVIDFPDSVPSPDCAESDICNDSLVKSWTMAQENFRTLSFEAPLAYDIPPENVKIAVLKDPPRVVVDLSKIFDKKLSLQVTPEVTWSRRELADSKGYIMVNRIEFPGDLKKVTMKILCANDNIKSRETTSSMASRYNALAAVNGGFFANSGGPLGLVYSDGKALSPHVKKRPPRTALVITDKNRVLFDRMILTEKGLATGEGISFTNARHVLGCGPRVVKEGAVAVTADEEGLGKSGNDITRRAGRTAVALTRKGTLAFYTVTGYFESHNSGVRLEELGQLMVDDQARDAFCLDGGHSSMMVIKGDPVSRAPGNRVPERKVANCLAIFQEGTGRFPCHIKGHVDRSELPADGKSTAAIELKVTDFQGRPVPDGTPVRFFTTLGSIPWYGATRGGTARSMVTSPPFPGKAAVSAECGFTRTEVAVIHFKAGEPSSLKALVAPLSLPLPENGRDEKGRLLQVLVRDEWYNPLASVSLQAEVFHGSSRLSVLSGVSNSRGVAEFRLQESVKGERLKVSCGKLTLLVTGKGSSAKQPVIDEVPDTKKGR